MTDKNPALFRYVFYTPNDAVYELRGGELYEAMGEQTDLFEVELLRDGDLLAKKPDIRSIFFLPPEGDGIIADFMLKRYNNETFIIDVCGPMLWPETLDPALNSPEVIAYWSNPVTQANGRNCIRRADAVLVHGEYLVELVSELNPNVFVVRDLNREEPEEDALRLTSDITRAIQFALQHPNRVDCVCESCIASAVKDLVL